MDDPLKKLIERRHPEYKGRLAHWDFVESTYEGGRDWFVQNIFRYLKEGDNEFEERVKRAYRFNHTREVIELVDKYLFKMAVTRREDDAPEAVKSFWKRSTLNDLDINAYARRISKLASIYGRPWVVVDSKPFEGVATKADERSGGVRIYSYVVRPQQVLDMSYDEQGSLNWILIHEVGRDDEDPLTSTGAVINRFRLWDKSDWRLYEIVKPKGRGKPSVELVDEGTHGLGRVPVFPADNTISEELYTSVGLVDDISYLDRAVANYLSNLDAIIQDQTFSQLAIPAQSLVRDEKAPASKAVEMGTKRVFTYDAEGGGAPMFLSPDVKQAELILKAIMKIINEIYHSVGLSGERTKDDNGGGADNSSGVAKGYDFERTNSLLASKADSLEKIENRLVELVMAWAGDTTELGRPLVAYPEDFDTRGLHDEFEIAARLQLLNAPEGVRREQMASLVDKLFPGLSDEDKGKLETELKSWPPEDLLAGLGAQGKPGTPGQAGPVKAAGNQRVAAELTAT
jgi:hypothetical protein